MSGTATGQLGFKWNGVAATASGLDSEIRVPEMWGDDLAFLRSDSPAEPDTPSAECRVPLVDLFSGVGGLSLGLHEAAKFMGLRPYSALAIDSDEQALDCYRDNFAGTELCASDVRDYFRSDFDDRLSREERSLRAKVPTGAILAGGPPCQGHSDLNNSTRRDDPKNSLYFVMARAARVLEPDAVVIENVPAVVHDRGGVVAMTREALESLGYGVSEHVFDFLKLGVAQSRKRHLMIACKTPVEDGMERIAAAQMPTRSIEWAIGDLANLTSRESLIDQVAKPNGTTQRRIDFLFDNDIYDLPNSERPACHRLKKHSYSSIYGRLRWDSPAQTITRGFYCMCMGRYVHPSEPRTLTAHEAARLQFFPDWFRFDSARTRTRLATMIGNAVPSKLGYLVGLELLSALGSKKRTMNG